MATTLKIESQRKGDHVHMQVRVGERPGDLAYAGALTMSLGEWQLFGATLLIGGRRSGLLVEMPDQETVTRPTEK